jgi:outer membrane protein insertion porin family
VGNVELLFPFPGMKGDKSVRGSVFFDAGRIVGDGVQPTFESFRYSTGVAVTWQSPIGLLKFSLAEPLRTNQFDRIQRFQFQFGNVF